MTVLVLNNIKANNNQNLTQSLQKINLISSWLINNITLNLHQEQTVNQMDYSIMKLIVNYQFQLLTITHTQDHLELIKSQKFLTGYTLTIFLMDSKDLNNKLSDIFKILTQFIDPTEEKKLDKFSDKDFETCILKVTNQLILIESLYKFWEKIITTLLNNKKFQENYSNKVSWIQNLIFSIEFYLSCYENLNKLLFFIENNNGILKIEEELISISTVVPDFKVVNDLVSLLRKYSSIESSDNQLIQK